MQWLLGHTRVSSHAKGVGWGRWHVGVASLARSLVQGIHKLHSSLCSGRKYRKNTGSLYKLEDGHCDL